MDAEFVAVYQLTNECSISGKAFLLVLSKHSPFVVFSRTSRRRSVQRAMNEQQSWCFGMDLAVMYSPELYFCTCSMCCS